MTDCVFFHGHGMSIGSETSGGVRNVTVRDCTFIDTENGLRIKSDAQARRDVENIRYENIVMSNVIPAITLTCFYQKNSGGCPGGPRLQTAPLRQHGRHKYSGLSQHPLWQHHRDLSQSAGKLWVCPTAALPMWSWKTSGSRRPGASKFATPPGFS